MFDTLSPVSIAVAGVALAAIIGTAGIMMINRYRDKRRDKAEEAVAKAAHDYFARFQIRARTIGAQLGDDSMILMVETPPHKKLRFSYIIEPPIKNFIRVQTGIEVARIFWRFPIPARETRTPDVKYADPDTLQLEPDQAQPGAAEPGAASPQPLDTESDDYFQQHQTYHIEEVSWEDFSTVSQLPAEANTTDMKPASTKTNPANP